MVQTTWHDDDERRVIEDVQQYGWHIIGVEEDQEGPAFAYSVGMYHTLQKPEVIIFGLDFNSAARVINDIGDEVRKGANFEDWKESDLLLEGCSCVFRQVQQDFYHEYFGYARWFYSSDDFPVLQCVWPDRQGRYPWHPAFPAGLQGRQPVLTRDQSWRFHEGKNRAVFTTRHVLDGTRPMLLVSHDDDSDWQFLCGTTNRTEDGRLVCLSCIVQMHPAVVELADLSEGWQAERNDAQSPWRRSRVDRHGDVAN